MRGEGAHVVDASGRRFLFDADPRGELAGRDVVASAIWRRLAEQGTDHVLLDCRPLGAAVRERFPTIAATCRAHGIDIAAEPIPIAPAAHYAIGGVRADIDGASTVAGLFACGEVASTGAHGANRLASNSLLEGAVFGRRAALAALDDIAERPARPPLPARDDDGRPRAAAHPPALDRLRDAMWGGCGVVRDAGGLTAALRVAEDAVERSTAGAPGHDPTVRLAATTATLVCRAALLREESRGAHSRADFPSTRDIWHGVLVMQKERGHRLDRNT
jgi:aspartate oxidase